MYATTVPVSKYQDTTTTFVLDRMHYEQQLDGYHLELDDDGKYIVVDDETDEKQATVVFTD